MRLVADHELVGLAGDRAGVAREPGVGLDRDRVAAERLLAALDRVGEAVAVALGGQVALELGDEQSPVGEDQDPERARGLDEAGGGDRLARGGRMAEAVAADGTRVLARELLRARPRPLLGEVLLGFLRLELGDVTVAVPFPFSSSSAWRWLAAISSVSIPASASIWCLRSSVPAAVVGRLRGEHALEPQEEAEADFPAGRGRAAAGLELGQRFVERGAAGGTGRQRFRRVFAGVEEGLSGPVLRAGRAGLEGIGRVRRDCRVQYRF